MCKQTEEELKIKLNIADYYVYMEIFCSVLIFGFLLYAKRESFVISSRYFVSMSTSARNYSAYVRFNEHATRVFDQRVYNPYDENCSRGYQMIQWLQNSIDKKVRNSIVRIDLAFDNE